MQGRALVAKKDDFEKWQDVIFIGLSAFTAAEECFRKAVALYEKLQDSPNTRASQEAYVDAQERKVHSEEMKK